MFQGRIFTGTADGRIISVRDGKFSLVARTGVSDPRCGTFELEPACGRPKGMKVWRDQKLYVVDSYKGLLRVDPESGVLETLISNEQGEVWDMLLLLGDRVNAFARSVVILPMKCL